MDSLGKVLFIIKKTLAEWLFLEALSATNLIEFSDSQIIVWWWTMVGWCLNLMVVSGEHANLDVIEVQIFIHSFCFECMFGLVFRS